MSQAMILLVWVAKATAVLLLAAGLTLALRRAPAGARYVVWLATLATLLVIPAVSSWSLIPVPVLPASASSLIAGMNAGATLANPAMRTPPTALPPSASPSESPSATPSTPRDIQLVEQSTAPMFSVARWALIGWAVVVGAILFWLLMGALAVRRIVRGAVTLDDDSWLHPMYDAADRLGLEHAPRVVMSHLIEMPFACGVAQPTIVLPRSAEQWSEERRRVVLFHELAHVRRRDLLGHTLGRLTCALYWFHPLVWSAAKRLRAESERACDDLVLACGGARPSEYANHLLEIVTSIRMQGAPATALPMADKKEFEGRMLAILDPAITRATPSRSQSVLLTLGLAALSFTVAAVTPTTRAAAAPIEPSVASYTPNVIPSDTQRATQPRAIAQRTASPAPATQPHTIQSVTTQTLQSTQTRTEVATSLWTQTTQGKSTAWGDPRALKENAQIDTGVLARVLRTDKDALVRKSAAWVLQGHPEGIPLLLERLRVDSDESVREMAAWGLASGRSSVVSGALAQALRSDRSSEVRSTAAWALGQMDAVDSMALISALADEDGDVREHAIWAIGQHRFTSVAPKLVPLLKDERQEVRLIAAWALGEMEDRSTIPALREAFPNERSSDVAQAEFRALLLMGDRSRELMDRAMQSPDPELRADAVRMMAGGSMRPWPWPWPWPWPRPNP
jgi:beta-lactamase regulating signal transducer with metallopeptidase domain